MTDSATVFMPPDALPAGTVIGGYTIQRVLGQGGFGFLYTTPEQAFVTAPPTVLSDIYTLAAITYYALVGKAPADSRERLQDLVYRDQDPYEHLAAKRLAGLPVSAAAAIDAALSLRPSDRPASVIEFMRALGFTPEEPTAPFVQPHAKPAKRSGLGRLIEHFRKRATRP